MKKYLALSIIALLFFAGCGKKLNNDSNESTVETNTADQNINIESNLEFIDLDNYSLDYNQEKDCVRGDYWKNMSYSENGYFFMSDSKLVTYADKESGLYLPLCSNPDCDHSNGNCVAYIYKHDKMHSAPYVYYYKGYVYYAAYDQKDDDNINLYRIKEDGSESEKYVTLYKNEQENENETRYGIPEIIIHRDAIYYIIPDVKELNVYRINLGEKEAKSVFSMDTERANVYRLRGYGDYVFFQAGNFVDDGMIEMKGGIYAINVNNNCLYEVLKDAISTYDIYQNQLIYQSNDKIMSFDLVNKGTPEVVAEIDGEENFICSDKDIFVFSKAHKFIQNFETQEKNNVENLATEDAHNQGLTYLDVKGYCDGIIFAENDNGEICYYQNGWKKFSYTESWK